MRFPRVRRNRAEGRKGQGNQVGGRGKTDAEAGGRPERHGPGLGAKGLSVIQKTGEGLQSPISKFVAPIKWKGWPRPSPPGKGTFCCWPLERTP